jgi:hypothetical protein
VSVQSELPPSITMSPASRSGVRPSMTASVPFPAWTRRTIFLGFEIDATNSSSVFVPRRRRACRVLGDELVGLLGGPVEHRDLEAVVGDVEGEVLAHDCEADEPDVGKWFSHTPAISPTTPRNQAVSQARYFLPVSPGVVACFVS